MPKRSSNDAAFDQMSTSTAWFVGAIVVVAVLTISYLVFSATTDCDQFVCSTIVEVAQ